MFLGGSTYALENVGGNYGIRNSAGNYGGSDNTNAYTTPQDFLHIPGNVRIGPKYATSDRDHIRIVPAGTTSTIQMPNENAIIHNNQGNIILRTGASTNAVTVSGSDASFAGEVFAEGYFETDSGELLSLNEDGWSANNQEHYVLYNGWRSGTGDYLLAKSSGNQNGGNGAILIADGNSGRVYFGKHANAALAIDSATAPLDTTYAYIGGSENYFSSNTFIDGIVRSRKNIVSNSTYNVISLNSSRTVDDYGGLNKDYMDIDLVTPGPNTDGNASAHGFGKN